MSAVAIAVRCHYCSKWHPAWNVHRLGTPERPAQTICAECLSWHYKALEFLAGRAMPGCQACGATWETLRDASPADVEVKLWIVPKDGIYQVLCASCVRPYVAARRDLYRGTPFGAERGI